MLVMSCSMTKAGSGWYHHLTNDLLVAAGHQDKIQIRERYDLHDILKYDNCHLGKPDARSLARLIRVSDEGNTFAIHTHKGPIRPVRDYMRQGKLKATYIYRDPRDVVVSAYEHGIRERAEGKKVHSFSKLRSIELAIYWIRIRQIPRYREWRSLDPSLVHFARYEDLVADPRRELERLSEFFGWGVPGEQLDEIIAGYAKDKGETREKRSLHFHKGIAGRFRDVLTPKQLALANKVYGPYLEEMGYAV